ncbi:NUDIX hydrolase [Micromonospora sp. AMSO31t]|uniref:NUDIX domain-containing protein n=1 Tax=Micromonospora sp. AMSO31t TaxID=2650566 RepID=UPI00124AF3E0|nr:NUDIX hydrolase [Micromonospora sp. AMSO31t]KAB1910684.1 NUDIX hydrolase [Micromonospora sp. AMSO31t]
MSGAADFPAVATPRVAAGVLFVDEHDRVMLVKPSYKPYWDIPGGYVEPGESPRAACQREILEELGITVPVGGMLAVDWAPHPAEGDKMLFIFDGGMLADEQLAAIQFQDHEITEFTFASPDDVERLTIPRLARRLHAALAAGAHQRPVYLEEGSLPAGDAAS